MSSAVPKVFVPGILTLSLLAAALQAQPASGAEPTEAAARSRQDAQRIIESHGFYGARDFSLDDAGAWRAEALKYDRRWRVDVDARGNFASAPAGPRGDLRGPAQGSAEDEAPAKKRPRAKVRLFLVLR